MRAATILACTFAIGLLACGGGETIEPLENEGFVEPVDENNNFLVTKANVDEEEVGAADWGCLGTASADEPTAVEITLTGALTDFQNMDNEIRDGNIEVFEEIDYQNPVDMAGPTLNDGLFELTLPAGTERWGFKLTAPDYMDTFLLNQYFDPDTAAQSQNISGISEGVATALPAIIGLTRTPGLGILAGAMRDCQEREVSYAVATVSATSGEVDHLDGAVTYYLDSGAGLPVRHDQLNYTDTIGTFAVFELPLTATAYIQVWGFVDDADTEDGEMTLLAELPAPVVSDTVVTGSIEPLRN
jgi:hypothetical protein